MPAGVPAWLLAAFALTSVATLFACYASLVARSPGVLAPFLAVSLWHIVENDRALARTQGGQFGLAAPSRRRGERAAVLATTVALLVFGHALLTPAEYGHAFDGTLVASLRGAAGLDLSGIRWLGCIAAGCCGPLAAAGTDAAGLVALHALVRSAPRTWTASLVMMGFGALRLAIRTASR